MSYKEKVIAFWDDMDKQIWDNAQTYFDENATINWNNTNESFNVEEFIRVNSEYPGDWSIVVERLECIDNMVISIVKVKLVNDDVSVHATSFFEFNNDRIVLLDEYWGDDGKAPQWRIDNHFSKPITRT